MQTPIAFKRHIKTALIGLLLARVSGKSAAISPGFRHLIELRCSQMNGCGTCMALHRGQAAKAGESEQRIQALHEWRTSPLFEARERTALDWAEALTGKNHTAREESLAERHRQFRDKDVAAITAEIAVINAWNVLGIAGSKPLKTERVE